MNIYVLLVLYYVTGVSTPQLMPDTTYIKTNSQKQCMDKAKEQIPIQVKLIGKKADIYDIKHYCIPVRMAGPDDVPAKKCATHMSSEYCVRGV